MWFFFALIIATGMAARILIPLNQFFDPELAMPGLAQQILPDVLIGFVLAGLFAAIMSTADSQIISCSAAISNDLFARRHPKYLKVKTTTILVTIFAALIAITDDQSVFSLAMISWIALACAFAPILIIYSIGGKISQNLAISMMFIGVVSMLFWRYFELGDVFYEEGAGMIFAFIYYYLVRIFYKIFKPQAW